MSSYWDALRRAALGLPGAAVPRPRSLFEREGGPELAEHGGEEETATAPPGGRPAPGLPEPRSAPSVPALAAEPPADRPGAPAGPPAEARPVAPSPPLDGTPPARQVISELRRETRVERETRVITERTEPRGDPSSPWALPSPPAPVLTSPSTSAERPPSEPPAGREGDPPRAEAPALLDAPPQVQLAEPVDDASEPVDPDRATEAVEPVESPPPLLIEIGRIEIRIAAEAAPAPRAHPDETRPVVALQDYLAKRSEPGR